MIVPIDNKSVAVAIRGSASVFKTVSVRAVLPSGMPIPVGAPSIARSTATLLSGSSVPVSSLRVLDYPNRARQRDATLIETW